MLNPALNSLLWEKSQLEKAMGEYQESVLELANKVRDFIYYAQVHQASFRSGLAYDTASAPDAGFDAGGDRAKAEVQF